MAELVGVELSDVFLGLSEEMEHSSRIQDLAIEPLKL
jgi:hypothetical protein